jgi:hypothetical protein
MREAAAMQASRIGPVARSVLDGGGEVEVLAVYERSAYLLLDSGIVCVGIPAIGNGPLNVLVPPRAGHADTTPFGLHPGMKGGCDGGRIVLDAEVVIGLAAAMPWTPPPWPTPGDMAAGIAALTAASAAHIPADGLAALIFAPGSPATRTRTAMAAAASFEELRRAVPTAIAAGRWTGHDLRAATLLVGLGPGLTPSGDDLIGGLMLALSARGETSLRDALWDAIAPELDDLTVPISAMHLAAAADGMGADAMHALIAAVVTGDAADVAARLPAAAALGATSGMDAIAGVVTGLA